MARTTNWFKDLPSINLANEAAKMQPNLAVTAGQIQQIAKSIADNARHMKAGGAPK